MDITPRRCAKAKAMRTKPFSQLSLKEESPPGIRTHRRDSLHGARARLCLTCKARVIMPQRCSAFEAPGRVTPGAGT
eukprot:8889109-Pyramimonas_sp.AAC.1